MRRIGIDVGGTNTDAVLVEGKRGPRLLQDTDHSRRYDGITDALSGVLERFRC